MKTKKFWYCEVDRMGQRTGNYYPLNVPAALVIKKNGCYYLGIDVIHNTGATQTAGTCFLFTSEEQAQRAALS